MWNLVGVQVKFGWVLSDMVFLPNSNHSYHSAQIQAEYMGEGKVLLLAITGITFNSFNCY